MKEYSVIRQIFFCCLLAALMDRSIQHGRLIEPPSRASAWRYGFSTPPNYNDHELYCGGYQRQWKINEGKCGECGDAYDMKKPRPHEHGGKWGQGVTVRQYKIGAEIPIRVELTASHMGYFEFRLCNDIQAEQSCLDKHLLKIESGIPSLPQPGDLETRFYPRNGSRIYEIRADLPEDMKCAHCVLQWRYVAGNNWGMCDDGNGAVGCGPQEEFRACADIAIGETKGQPPLRPSTKRPTKPTKPTKTPVDTPEETTETSSPEPLPTRPQYMGPMVAIFSLFLVLFGFAAIYLYHYHGQRLKYFMRWRKTKEMPLATGKNMVPTLTTVRTPSVVVVKPSLPPPVPPPRTKRLARIDPCNEKRATSEMTDRLKNSDDDTGENQGESDS